MWGFCRKTAICKPGRRPSPDLTSMLAPWSQTFLLPELWKAHFYCFSHLVYGILLEQLRSLYLLLALLGDGQGGLAYCSLWGRKESDMTERLNWIELACNKCCATFTTTWCQQTLLNASKWTQVWFSKNTNLAIHKESYNMISWGLFLGQGSGEEGRAVSWFNIWKLVSTIYHIFRDRKEKHISILKDPLRPKKKNLQKYHIHSCFKESSSQQIINRRKLPHSDKGCM